MKKYALKITKKQSTPRCDFAQFWSDLGRFSGGPGTAKPSIPSNTSLKILKIARCNFGPLKNRLQNRFLTSLGSKLVFKIDQKMT